LVSATRELIDRTSAAPDERTHQPDWSSRFASDADAAHRIGHLRESQYCTPFSGKAAAMLRQRSRGRHGGPVGGTCGDSGERSNGCLAGLVVFQALLLVAMAAAHLGGVTANPGRDELGGLVGSGNGALIGAAVGLIVGLIVAHVTVRERTNGSDNTEPGQEA
jgi:hypothetical protein